MVVDNLGGKVLASLVQHQKSKNTICKLPSPAMSETFQCELLLPDTPTKQSTKWALAERSQKRATQPSESTR